MSSSGLAVLPCTSQRPTTPASPDRSTASASLPDCSSMMTCGGMLSMHDDAGAHFNCYVCLAPSSVQLAVTFVGHLTGSKPWRMQVQALQMGPQVHMHFESSCRAIGVVSKTDTCLVCGQLCWHHNGHLSLHC